MLGFAERQEAGAKQRTASQIERASCFRLGPLTRVSFATGEVDRRQREVDLVFDPLKKFIAAQHEMRAQRFVPRDERHQGRFERGGVQRAGEREDDRHVVRCRSGIELIEEPQTLLRVRHRQRAGARHADDRLDRAHGVAAQRLLDALGHLRDRRRFEQAAQRHLHVERLPHPRHHARREQRVAAEIEEVVVDAEVLDAEYFRLRPDLAEQTLDGGSRRLVLVGVAACFDVGEGLAIDFAVHRQRQRVEYDNRRRDFVLREPFLEELAEFDVKTLRVAADRCACRERSFVDAAQDERRGLGPCDIGEKPGIARGRATERDRGLRHVGMRFERRFDLAELDAVAADLHLIVGAAQILDRSVRAIARAIARAIQPRAAHRRERIRHEPVGGQIGPALITARDARPADVDVAGHANGDLREIRVEQVHLQVRDRPADRHRAQVVVFGGVVDAAADHGFRRSVFVDESCAARVFSPELQRRSAQRFSADHQSPDMAAEIDIGQPLFEDFEMRRRQLQQTEVVAVAQHLRQSVDVSVGCDQRHRSARDQREIETCDRQIETERRVDRRPIAIGDRIVLGRPLQIVGEPAMRDHRALRPAGRPRRVNHIGELLRRDLDARVRDGARDDLRPVAIEMDDPDVRGADPQRQKDVNLRVDGHVLQPFGGIARVERHVGAARLQHTDERHDHLDRSLHRDPDARFGSDADPAQVMRHLIRAAVQRRIADAIASADDGRRGWRLRHLRFEQLDDRPLRKCARGVVPARDLKLLGRRQKLEVRNTLLRIGGDRVEQRLVVRDDALDGRAVEEIGVVFERPEQAAFALFERHVQVDLRRAGADIDRLDVESWQLEGARRVLQRQQHLAERRAAEIAFRLQRLDELVERQLLMRVAIEAHFADACQQLAKRRIAADVGPQDQHVHEEADQPFDFGVAPIGDR